MNSLRIIKLAKSIFIISIIIILFLSVAKNIDYGYCENYKSIENQVSEDVYLQQYSRTPISIKISRIINMGIDKYNRGKYSEAIEIFEQIFRLEPRNLAAIYWIRKCREKENYEKNQKIKRELYNKYKALLPRMEYIEEKLETWEEAMNKRLAKVRVTKKQPKKERTKPTKEELDKAIKEAESGEPKSLFKLAMVYWAMGDKKQALKYYEEAVELDPEIAAFEDNGMLAKLHDEIIESISKNTASANTYLDAGRLARLQGNIEEMVKYLVKAVTLEETYKEEARKYFEYLIFSNKIEMFLRLPDIYSFRIAYAYDTELQEDRIYLKLAFKPLIPVNICPIDINVDWTAIKKVDIVGKDILYAIVDPNVKDITRLWIIVREKNDENSIFYDKLVIHMEKEKTTVIELSNPNDCADLTDNWAIVIGKRESFGEGILQPNYIKNINEFEIRFYKIGTKDKGISLPLKNFRISLPSNINVLEILDDENLNAYLSLSSASMLTASSTSTTDITAISSSSSNDNNDSNNKK